MTAMLWCQNCGHRIPKGRRRVNAHGWGSKCPRCREDDLQLDKRGPLARLVMVELRAWENAKEMIGWKGVLALDGVPVLRVSNEGLGGCNTYEPMAKKSAGFRELVDLLEEAARAATGMKSEALDALTACMEQGGAAESAVAEVKSWTT